jgi:hypothetical protein
MTVNPVLNDTKSAYADWVSCVSQRRYAASPGRLPYPRSLTVLA